MVACFQRKRESERSNSLYRGLIKRGRQDFLSLLNLRFMLGVICTDKDIYFQPEITQFSQQLITDCKASPEGSRTIPRVSGHHLDLGPVTN